MLGGIVLRMLAMLGYRPALWFVGDSYTYVAMTLRSALRPERPGGYPLMLRALEPFHSFVVVVGVQHVSTLATTVMIYVLLRRRGLPDWGATLVVLPVLFDAYLIQLEHLLLSDTVFIFLVVSALTALLWHERPTAPLATAAGVLLALATLTRTIGFALLLLLPCWLIVRRAGWRTLAVTALTTVLPLVAYAVSYHSRYQRYALSGAGGVFLWSRAMSFADCAKIHPPAGETALCPVPGLPRMRPETYVWNASSPINRLPTFRFTDSNNTLAEDFAERAILAQPGDYLSTVAHSVARTFRWSPTEDYGVALRYEFHPTEPAPPVEHSSTMDNARNDMAAYDHQPPQAPRVVEPYAGWIRGYQHHVFLPGPILGLMLLGGLAGIVAAWRSWGGPALLPWAAAMVLLILPPATIDFDYRYVLPAIPLACLSLGIGLARGVRAPAPWDETGSCDRPAADARRDARATPCRPPETDLTPDPTDPRADLR
ncbi:hypothetical protein GCM10029978_086600 [Actinoallomurus acanthiterrae]